MLRYVKRVFSVLLTAALVLCGALPAFAAEEGGEKIPLQNSTRVNVPTVYVQGYGAYIYADANDRNSAVLYNGVPLSDEALNTLINGIKDPLLKGVKTGDWTEYCDFVVDTLAPELGKYKLDNNGEPSDGSGNTFHHDINVNNRKGSDGKYDVCAYIFNRYDWRLDPLVIADQLNAYIKDVKEKTGFDKVNLVARCFGTNVAMAYLHKYGYGDISTLTFYMGLFDGVDVAGALFSGRVSVSPAAINRYVERYVPDDDGNMSLIKALIPVINAINGLQLPVDIIMKVYDKVYQDIIPRLLLKSYATCPCYWSYVGEKYYEDAKKLVFGGQEEQYAELIRKIDNYHNNVMLKVDDIVGAAAANGVNIYNVVKYGGSVVPVCEEAKYCSDGVTSVKSQSFGSVSSEMEKPFGEKYLKKAEKNGTLKYISPDNLIDASGDTFRDHTWFVKGIDHKTMVERANVLFANIFNADNSGTYVTVEHFSDCPQFLIASKDAYDAELVPMTRKNADDNNPRKSLMENLSYLLRRLRDFLNKLLAMIRNAVVTVK